MKYKNIIFDVGDVLLQYRWKDMLVDYGLSAEEAERVGTELFDNPERLWSEFDLGEIPDEELIARYSKKYPKDKEAIAWFIRHGEYMHVARPAVWKMVKKLKQEGYGIYLLSNYSEGLFKKHTEYADFMQDIDGMVVSYMVNKAKPDRAIYQALCDKYNLKPEECLFFDDRAENVEGAVKFGMDSIQVVSQKQLLTELEKL